MPTNVTLAMVREAAARIRPVAQRTPVLTSKTFDREAGVSAFFKCENFQKGGAFKIRGAANLIFSLSDTERAKGLIAYSSGNHAQATACPTCGPSLRLRQEKSHDPHHIRNHTPAFLLRIIGVARGLKERSRERKQLGQAVSPHNSPHMSEYRDGYLIRAAENQLIEASLASPT